MKPSVFPFLKAVRRNMSCAVPTKENVAARARPNWWYRINSIKSIKTQIDIIYGKGISKEGDILDLAAENDIIVKSGSWYAFEGNRIGQGREAAVAYITEHKDACDEVEKRVREKYQLPLFI